MDEITEDTGVIPKDSAKQDASGKVVVTGAFSGVTYPDKLESFLHGWVSCQSNACCIMRILHSAKQELCWHDQTVYSTWFLMTCVHADLMRL